MTIMAYTDAIVWRLKNIHYANFIERNFMKTAKSSLEAANQVVPRIEVKEAIKKHGQGSAIFIDVRDGLEIAETGTIKDALKIPRGFIEFAADSETPFHNKALEKDAEIIIVCAAGGMAALTGHTLIEMGYKNVSNVGGFADWKNADGPVDS